MKTKDTNRFFNAARTGKTLTLSMYDTIGGDLFSEGITPGMVQDALSQSDYTDVTIRLNSPGGSAFDGVAIYNVLRASGKPVNVIVDGMAASAASIVMMAGDTRTVNTGAMVMIHEAMALAMGNAADMLKMADTLTAVTGSIADIYVERTGLPKDEVLSMQAVETWMSADEAVTKGFATAVNKQSAVKNSYNLTHFRNAPAELKAEAKTKEVDGEHLTAGDFVYVGNPDDTSTWSLPWHFSTEEKTQSHLRDALARFDQDEVIPEAHKAEAYAKLVRLCGEHGVEVSTKANNDAQAHKLKLLALQLEINKRK